MLIFVIVQNLRLCKLYSKVFIGTHYCFLFFFFVELPFKCIEIVIVLDVIIENIDCSRFHCDSLTRVIFVGFFFLEKAQEEEDMHCLLQNLSC